MFIYTCVGFKRSGARAHATATINNHQILFGAEIELIHTECILCIFMLVLLLLLSFVCWFDWMFGPEYPKIKIKNYRVKPRKKWRKIEKNIYENLAIQIKCFTHTHICVVYFHHLIIVFFYLCVYACLHVLHGIITCVCVCVWRSIDKSFGH